jgi:hypothetical protein
MEIWVKDNQGRLVATMVDGRLYGPIGFDTQRLAFELWQLSVKLVSVDGGSAGFGFTNPVEHTAVDDIEGGTP